MRNQDTDVAVRCDVCRICLTVSKKIVLVVCLPLPHLISVYRNCFDLRLCCPTHTQASVKSRAFWVSWDMQLFHFYHHFISQLVISPALFKAINQDFWLLEIHWSLCFLAHLFVVFCWCGVCFDHVQLTKIAWLRKHMKYGNNKIWFPDLEAQTNHLFLF